MVAKIPVRSDKELRESVVLELEWDPKITSRDIAVAVKDGVVTLSGFTHSYWEKDAAEKAAKRVYGVRGVANDIEVKLTSTRTDPELARDAVQALESHASLPADRLKVTVRNGWVTSCASPFATSRSSTRIRMRSMPLRRPKPPPRKESSGRCTTSCLKTRRPLTMRTFGQYATALGLDGRRLIREIVAGTHTERVREDFRSGARGGVNGTPTFFINGVRYDGGADTLLESLVEGLK